MGSKPNDGMVEIKHNSQRSIYNFENTKCSVCRWGGEEFLIVNEYDCSEDAVIAKFEELRKTVENCDVIYGDKIIKITITIKY